MLVLAAAPYETNTSPQLNGWKLAAKVTALRMSWAERTGKLVRFKYSPNSETRTMPVGPRRADGRKRCPMPAWPTVTRAFSGAFHAFPKVDGLCGSVPGR